MIFPSKIRLTFRIISALIGGIFLFQQIAWAGGGELLTTQAATPKPIGTNSDKLQSSQAASIQNSVAIQSAVEQAQDTSNVTIATASQTPLLAQAASSPTYTYYTDGRMQSQTLTTPDASGMIYYHYLDENWNGQGYGRADREIKAVADSKGAIAYEYEYFGMGGDVVINDDTTWGEGIYNFNSITIAKGKTLTITGNSYIYSNASVKGGGNLNIQGGTIYTPSITAGTLTIGAGSTVTIAPISGGPLGSPSPSSLSKVVYKTRTYKNADFTGLVSTNVYYTSGRLQSYTFTAPDQWGNVYYHFIDENWNSQGYGRVDKFIAAKADNEGAIAYTYQYFGQGPNIIIKDNTTWSEGTYSYNSITIMAGKTLTITGTARLYSNVGIRGKGNIKVENGNFYAPSISCGTLTIGAGSTVTIAPIAGGLLGAAAEPDFRSKVYVHKAYSDAGFTNIVYQYVNQINGDFVMTKYWPGTTKKYQDIFAKKGWAWQNTVEYYEDGRTVHCRSAIDPNPNTPGDITSRAYDLNGRVISLTYDTNCTESFEYYGVTSNIYRHNFGNQSGTWQKTIEYYEDGVTMHYQWIADAHPGTTGDVITIVYNTEGMQYLKELDSGAQVDYTMASYYANWQYLSSTIRVATDPCGEIATFKYINNKWVINSVVWNGSLASWSYNTSGQLTGYAKTLADGTVKKYDATNKLIETDAPSSNFVSGANLPWINYGNDIGSSTGFSNNLAALYNVLDQWKGSTVRVFLFSDLRSGITFDVSGNPTSFNGSVFNDMQVLLDAAKAFDIKLIPVLFDYMIADGKSGTYLGEHPDLITDASKKQALLGLFGTFFDKFANDSSIYAWDVMNEPEFSGAVSIDDAHSFVSDFVKLIHSKSQNALVTLGSARRDWMLKYWTDISLDIYQFHYYDSMESNTSINYSVSQLGLNKPVIVGELQPTSVTSKLNTISADGYAGGLFWQDQGDYKIGATDYASIRSWFKGTKSTYDYYASGRIKDEFLSDGTLRLFEDAAFYKDGTGRLIKETFIDTSYTTYQYYDSASTLKMTIHFSASGSSVMKKNYDSTGAVTTITTYYDSGSVRKIANSDGTYQALDQAGATLEQAIKIGDIISIKDGQNKLLREILKDGTIKEYSLDGKLIRMLKPNGAVTEYYYNADGSVLNRFECLADGSFTIFNGQGNTVYTYTYKASDLQEPQDDSSALSLKTALGDTIKYKNDKIVSIERKTDGAIITDIELDVGGNLKNARVVHVNGSVDIVYNNSVIETISSDGTVSRYRDSRKTFDYSKTIGYTRYYYTEDVSHNITSVTTVNKNAVCVYDKDGLPIRFEKADGSVTEYDSGYLKRITDSTGRQYLYTIVTGPNPSSTLIVTVTGNSIPAKVLYDAAKNITSVVSSDGTTLTSSDGILQGITGLDSKIKVEAGGAFSFDNQNYKTYYDKNGNLERITTPNNSSVYFNNGQISEVESEDGTRVIYTGGRVTDLYDRREGAHYESDSQGRVTKVTYDNGAIFNYQYTSLSDAALKVTITKEGEPANVTIRIYDKDGLLVEQDLPSGIISKYTYEASGGRRILSVIQAKNSAVIGSYIYDYTKPGKVLVADINQNKREYDTSGNIKFMYTPEGYVYEYRMTEQDTLVSEMVRWVKGGGVTIYYKNGDVDRVETIGTDGKKTVLKDVVFNSDGKLKTFTVILPTGESRRCTVYDGGWSEINTSDAKLIYKDDSTTGNGRLVAVNSNHRLLMFDNTIKIPSYINVDITNDPSALDHIALVDGEMTDYTRQKLLKDYGVIKEDPVPNTLVPGNRTWQRQTYSDTLGISSISTGGDMIVMQADINNTSGHNQGEAFLDLTINNIGHTISAPYDFNNKTMSFYVKLQDGTLPAGGSLTVQAFVKDANWSSEYSTQITITQAGVWCKIDLDISNVAPMFGLKDSLFDPSKIRLVGIRIVSTAANFTYNGQIFVKDANHQSVPAGEKVIDFPFFVNKNSIKPYVGAIPADQVSGNPNYISWTDIPTFFLPPANSTDNGQINLDKGTWRSQTYAYSTGVETVTRDDANNQWVLGLNLTAGDQAKNDGEMYVDLRYDIPGYKWSGPIDLAGKTLTFKVKAPAGFLAASSSESSPMWAQVFVKDEKYNYQYGKYVQITQEGEWITVTLIPQAGEIEGGNSKTSPDFDPTKIINIGIKISCNKGSVSAYKGNFYVQNATPVDILNQATGVYLLDINALKNYAADKKINLTFEENLGPQIRLAKQSLPTYFKDSSFNMATEYYPDGSVKSVLKGNSRVEYYNTEGKLIKITDKNDATLVEYKYDSNGDLTEIDYSGTRDAIRKAMDDASLQAQIEADNTIKEIAEAKGYAVQYIKDTIQPALDEAYATEARLRGMWNEWNGKKTGWFGETSREEKKAVMHSLEAAIGQMERTISSLLAKAAEMYANIDTNINKAKQDIQTQFNASLQAINTQENTEIAETLKQEVIEVIDVYYKKVLGRGASTDEINSWLSKAQTQGCLDPINRKAFDVSLVKTELATNQQYIDEVLANNTFINDVNTAVAAYLRGFASITDKNAALASYLGLSVSDINYSASDFEAIIKWLSSNNKHFGKSAFTALAEMLKNNGKTLSAQDLEELAAKVILIDIFSGSITSITTGELEISMFALSKYASAKYNITLYNTKLSNKTLVSLQDAISGGKEVIVRVSGDHFVVVTSIAADGTVSYLESSRGKLGEVMTMKKTDFLSVWDGYAITQKTPFQDSISKVLSAAEARLIRGSDPTIIAVLAIISLICAVTSTILSFIDNEICQMLSKVFAIVSLVTGVLSIVSNFGNIVSNFMTGLQNISETMKSSTIWLGEMFKHGVEGFVTGMASILSKAVSGICLNMSYNKALTAFGLNSDLAGITSAFLSGGFSFTGATPTFSLTQGFASLTLEGVRYAGKELGLDPTITSIIGMSAATIVSSGLGGVAKPVYENGIYVRTDLLTGLDAISYTIGTTVLPNVASELAYYGITKLGEALGIDSIVSQIAGIGIRSTISAGLRGYNTDDWYKTAIGGLIQGVASIGINYATQELGLNPLLANIGFSAIASAINAGIQAATGGSQDVFKSFFDTYINNALTFLGYGNITDPNYAWLEASYKASILDFSDIVRQKGLVEALNIYGTSFFNSTTVGAIAQSGMTIGKYFDSKIKAGQYAIDTTSEGIDFAKIVILKDGDIIGYGFFSWDGVNVGVLMGKEEIYQDHTFWGLGGLGKDSYGSLGFWNDSTLMDAYSTFKNIQKIDNGNLISQEVKNSIGNIIITTTAPSSSGITYNSDGSYVDAVLNNYFEGYKIELKDDEILRIYNESTIKLDASEQATLATFGIHGVDELGTLYYYLTDDNHKVSFSNLYFQWNNEIQNILHENPYLLPYIVDLASANVGGNTQLFNAFFNAARDNFNTPGTITRENKSDIDYVVDYFKASKPLSNTVVIMVPGTSPGQIVADATNNTQYLSRTEDWANDSYTQQYLRELGAQVVPFVWDGNTPLGVDDAAWQLAATIIALKSSGKNVVVVGHSAGDWISRKAFDLLGSNSQVDTYVGLGSPETNKNTTISSHVGEWYNITSEKDIVTATSGSYDMTNANQIRFRDLIHTDYFGSISNDDIGASGNIIKILLKDKYEEILRGKQ